MNIKVHAKIFNKKKCATMNKKYIRYTGVIGILSVLIMVPILIYFPTTTVSLSTRESSSKGESPVLDVPSEQPTSSIIYSPDGYGQRRHQID